MCVTNYLQKLAKGGDPKPLAMYRSNKSYKDTGRGRDRAGAGPGPGRGRGRGPGRGRAGAGLGPGWGRAGCHGKCCLMKKT